MRLYYDKSPEKVKRILFSVSLVSLHAQENFDKLAEEVEKHKKEEPKRERHKEEHNLLAHGFGGKQQNKRHKNVHNPENHPYELERARHSHQCWIAFRGLLQSLNFLLLDPL